MDIDCNSFDLIITFSLNSVQVKNKQAARCLHGPVLFRCAAVVFSVCPRSKSMPFFMFNFKLLCILQFLLSVTDFLNTLEDRKVLTTFLI